MLDHIQLLAQHPASTTLAAAFAEVGAQLYVVGGAVRDALLARDSDGVSYEDLDYTTDADVAVIEQLLTDAAAAGGNSGAVWTTGREHGCIAAIVAGVKVEVTAHRADSYDSSTTRNATVSFNTDIVGDLARRDLTINAIAAQLHVTDSGHVTAQLIDPHHGWADLAARIIATPGPADQIISDDPLRSLRALRFAARFNATIADELEAAITGNAGRLAILSAERIADELRKTAKLGTGAAAAVLTNMRRLNIDRELLGISISDKAAGIVAQLREPISIEGLLAAIALSEKPGSTPARPAGIGATELTLRQLTDQARRGTAGQLAARLKVSGHERGSAINTTALAWLASIVGRDATLVEARTLVRLAGGQLPAALQLAEAAGKDIGALSGHVEHVAAHEPAVSAPLAVTGHDAAALGHRGAGIKRALHAACDTLLADPHATRQQQLNAMAGT